MKHRYFCTLLDLIFLTLGLCFSYLVIGYSHPVAQAEQGHRASDPEVGNVAWGRNFKDALKQSQITGKPVFVLFQEVPGCHGCKKFGQTVLVDPLIVEAIEDEFIPILVYNNRGGKDAEILKRYREPSWNFQVIRFLNEKGEDIIPRKDKVWTKAGVVDRMIGVLQKSGREVPLYLKGVQYSNVNSLEQAAFAMHCYWTGELKLGGVEGVVKTEAGWYESREVTRVWYNPSEISLNSLISKAAKVDCADKVFIPKPKLVGAEMINTLRLKSAVFDLNSYRKAKASDQKKQIQGSKLLQLGLSDFQLTKVNAYARRNKEKMFKYLSPRQRKLLASSKERVD